MTYTIQHKDNDTVYDYSLNEKGKNTYTREEKVRQRKPKPWVLHPSEREVMFLCCS